MRHAIVPLLALSLACRSGDPIAEAKAVVADHETAAMAGNLDGVLANVAPDIVVLTAGEPLIEGPEAFRDFYGELLAAGRWEFGHDYTGDEAVGDLVALHGVARGTLTPHEGEPAAFANNFILLLRRQADGRFRFWRVAFAPGGE